MRGGGSTTQTSGGMLTEESRSRVAGGCGSVLRRRGHFQNVKNTRAIKKRHVSEAGNNDDGLNRLEGHTMTENGGTCGNNRKGD